MTQLRTVKTNENAYVMGGKLFENASFQAILRFQIKATETRYQV